jgi:hypothetical protein
MGRIMQEIDRGTGVVGSLPDGISARMLLTAKLRYA